MSNRTFWIVAAVLWPSCYLFGANMGPFAQPAIEDLYRHAKDALFPPPPGRPTFTGSCIGYDGEVRVRNDPCT